MKKNTIIIAAISLLFLLISCSSGDDGESQSSKYPANWIVDGVEKILTITGLEQYNGYYVVVNFYPYGFGDPSNTVYGNMQGACGGANTQERNVENGKIELSIVDFGNLINQDLSVKDTIVFKPCEDGEYMLQLSLIKNKKELEDGAKVMQSAYYYTNDELDCVSSAFIGLGMLPLYDFQGNQSVDFSKFTKTSDDFSNPYSGITCMPR